MLSFTLKQNDLLISSVYNYYFKNGRKFFTSTSYSKNKKLLDKKSNKRLMFKRAPKHFKLGKQQIVYFIGVYSKTTKFFLNRSLVSLFVDVDSGLLFDLLINSAYLPVAPAILPQKIILKGTVSFKINI